MGLLVTGLESNVYLLGPSASLAQVCFIIEWPPSLTNESPPSALKSTMGWVVSGEGPQHHRHLSSRLLMQSAVAQRLLDY